MFKTPMAIAVKAKGEYPPPNCRRLLCFADILPCMLPPYPGEEYPELLLPPCVGNDAPPLLYPRRSICRAGSQVLVDEKLQELPGPVIAI